MFAQDDDFEVTLDIERQQAAGSLDPTPAAQPGPSAVVPFSGPAPAVPQPAAASSAAYSARPAGPQG